MLFSIVKTFILIFILSLFFTSCVYAEDSPGKERENYRELKRVYDKWNSGLFGSRTLYKNRLYRLLTDMIGADIQTGKDYKISILEVLEKKCYSSDLYNQNWLYIHGPADEHSIKEFLKKGNDYIKEVEINKQLFFLSGRIEKFRIIETGSGRTVHLYLDSVKISDSMK